MRVLAHPPLGLVLVLVALHALPGQLTLFVSPAFSWSWQASGLLIVQLATTCVQLATGAAIISGHPGARALFTTYVLASIAIVASAVYVMHGEGLALRAGVAVETLGLPLLIALVPTLAQVETLSAERSRSDAAAALLVLGVAGLLAGLLYSVGQARMLARDHVSIEVWLGRSIPMVISLATGIAALIAGQRMQRAEPARARRALVVYMVIAIGGVVTLALLTIVFSVVDDSQYKYTGYLIRVELIALVHAATPLAIWLYVRPALHSQPQGGVSQGFGWLLLVFVPTLVARVFMAGPLSAIISGAQTGLVLGLSVVLAIGNTLAATAILRGDPSARRRTQLAAALSLAILLVAIVLVEQTPLMSRPGASPLAPLMLLLAAAAVPAWLARRVV